MRTDDAGERGPSAAWLFGLQHFGNEQNLWWPIVLGAVLLGVYWAASGVAFAGLVDRVLRLTHPASMLVAGATWGFVSFMFFWYMLLPIARDGALFRAQAGTSLQLFVAPNWVWILGFTLLGLVTGACYAALHRSAAIRRDEPADGRTSSTGLCAMPHEPRGARRMRREKGRAVTPPARPARSRSKPSGRRSC